MTIIFGKLGSVFGKAQSCLTESLSEVTNCRCSWGVKIPAHAEMNVIRPNMQLSGGVAAVSLKSENIKRRDVIENSLLCVYVYILVNLKL